MDAFVAAVNGDAEEALSNASIVEENLTKVESFTVSSLNGKENVVKVGEKRIKPLLRESVVQIKSLLMNKINAAVTNPKAEVFSSDESLNGVSLILDTGSYFVDDLKGKLDENGYIGFNLPKAHKLSEISVQANQNNNLDIQYSLNGIEWIMAESKLVDGVLKVDTPVSATYVRVINKTNEEIEIDISKMKVEIIYNVGKVVASTNIPTKGNNAVSKMVDKSIWSRFEANTGATPESYISIDLGKAIPLVDFKISYSSLAAAFDKTKLEISTDAITWTEIGIVDKSEYTKDILDGMISYAVNFNAEGKMAKYVRFGTPENDNAKVQVIEVWYNETVSFMGDDTIDLVESNFAVKDSDNLFDGDLSTALTTDNINDGDYLIYKMTTIKNVDELLIIQDKNNISGAKVSVKSAEGGWKEAGVLDKQTNVIKVNDIITEVKLSFDAAKPLPKIYEIIAKERIISKLNKDALQIAVEMANNVTEEKLDEVVPAVVTEFKAALAEAKEILNDVYTSQDKIDASFTRLASTMHMLEFLKGDKTGLQDLVDSTAKLVEENYTEESWSALQDVLTKANIVLKNENAMQEEVNETYDNLQAAINGLEEIEVVDKSLLEAMVNKVLGLVEDKYIPSTWSAMLSKLEVAQEVLGDEKATQAKVDKAWNDLTKALQRLETVKAGGTTASIKTGDNGLMIVFAGLSMLSIAGLSLLRKKEG